MDAQVHSQFKLYNKYRISERQLLIDKYQDIFKQIRLSVL